MRVFERLYVNPLQAFSMTWRILHNQCGSKKGEVLEVAIRLELGNQLLIGKILVREGFEDSIADPFQQLCHRLIGIYPRA